MTNTSAELFPHLNSVAAELMSATDAERVAAIQKGSWIPYPRANDILDRLEYLLAHERVIRMPHMLLVGESNNGKSFLLHRFLDKHPIDPNAGGEAIVQAVVYVELPASPNLGEFYDWILDALDIPRRRAATNSEKEFQVRQVLTAVGTRILILDEIQHIFASGPVKQREFRNAIKTLGNKLMISIVAAGVEEAFNAFNTDPQLSNRFRPEALPRWKLDMEFGRLLATFERRIPLRKPSNLTSPELMLKLYGMSEGLIGEIATIIELASVKAIRTRKECIDEALLDQLDWKRPSVRTDRRAYGL